jgi:beta-1,2-mannobiose phosphorylase / 1,2-beta-oligomannan phosphorylase
MVVKVKKEDLLLAPADIKPTSKLFEVIGVLNPAAVRLPDGNIMLYVRVIEKLKKTSDKKYCYSPRMIGDCEFKVKIDKFKKSEISEYTDVDFLLKDGNKRLTFISHFRRVLLDESGFNMLHLEKTPSFYGTKDDGEFGVEDPRITKIDNLYIMTYVSLSSQGDVSTSYAISTDCMNWSRQGIIFGEHDKDVVIFPEKVNGRYVAFNRPEGNFQFSQPHIWIGYSSGLKSWGDLGPIPSVYEEHGFCPRNGSGPPPIKTKKGWLLLYHAVTEFAEEQSQKEIVKKLRKIVKLKEHVLRKIAKLEKEIIVRVVTYSIGAALFDLNNPEKLIARTKNFLIAPNGKYEESFENKRVIFPTGLVYDKNGKDLLVYCGAGDSYTTVKKISLSDIMKKLSKVC